MTGLLWRAQADQFGGQHQMVLVDPPGHGGSEPLTRYFTLEECATCVVQILDHLAIEDCVLLGNSWGGMMGGLFAALHGSRLRAAVLMNCTAETAGWRQKLEYSLMVQLVRRIKTPPGPLLDKAVKSFLGKTSERTRPELVAAVRASVASADGRSVAWAIASVVPRRADHRARLAGVQKPVLVVAGAEDRTFPVAETERMARAIPGSEFVVLPEVGHLAAAEAPDAVNAAIREFLRRRTG